MGKSGPRPSLWKSEGCSRSGVKESSSVITIFLPLITAWDFTPSAIIYRYPKQNMRIPVSFQGSEYI